MTVPVSALGGSGGLVSCGGADVGNWATRG